MLWAILLVLGIFIGIPAVIGFAIVGGILLHRRVRMALGRDADANFIDEVSAIPGGEGVRSCIQCGVCSGSCPNTDLMDYSPRKMIALIRAGKRYEVLSSNSMWVCASCYLCTARCPKNVKPTELMHTLECLAVRHGLANGKTKTPAMYRAFFDSVRSNGRVREFRVMTNYYLKTNPLAAIEMIPIALRLLSHRRMPLRGEKINGIEQLRTIIDKARALGGAE